MFDPYPFICPNQCLRMRKNFGKNIRCPEFDKCILLAIHKPNLAFIHDNTNTKSMSFSYPLILWISIHQNKWFNLAYKKLEYLFKNEIIDWMIPYQPPSSPLTYFLLLFVEWPNTLSPISVIATPTKFSLLTIDTLLIIFSLFYFYFQFNVSPEWHIPMKIMFILNHFSHILSC